MGCTESKNDNTLFDAAKPLKDAKIPIIWILGGPGSGKLTQCKLIAAKYNYTHLCLEYLLRTEVTSGSEIGKIIREKLAKNELIPTDLELKIFVNAMLKTMKKTKGFLIDGYPRDKEEAISFEQEVIPCSMIIYFQTTENILVKRVFKRESKMKMSRSKRKKSADIKSRIQNFVTNMADIIALLPYKLKRVNAADSIQDVFTQVQKEIDSMILNSNKMNSLKMY